MPKVELIPMKNPNEAGVDEVGEGVYLDQYVLLL